MKSMFRSSTAINELYEYMILMHFNFQLKLAMKSFRKHILCCPFSSSEHNRSHTLPGVDCAHSM